MKTGYIQICQQVFTLIKCGFFYYCKEIWYKLFTCLVENKTHLRKDSGRDNNFYAWYDCMGSHNGESSTSCCENLSWFIYVYCYFLIVESTAVKFSFTTGHHYHPLCEKNTHLNIFTTHIPNITTMTIIKAHTPYTYIIYIIIKSNKSNKIIKSGAQA